MLKADCTTAQTIGPHCVRSTALVCAVELGCGDWLHWVRSSLAKTKVLDFGLSPAQKFLVFDRVQLDFGIDQSLRPKPKVLDSRV